MTQKPQIDHEGELGADELKHLLSQHDDHAGIAYWQAERVLRLLYDHDYQIVKPPTVDQLVQLHNAERKIHHQRHELRRLNQVLLVKRGVVASLHEHLAYAHTVIGDLKTALHNAEQSATAWQSGATPTAIADANAELASSRAAERELNDTHDAVFDGGDTGD